MYIFHESLPLSRPPPVSFSPPNAPPISAPLVPVFTLAMPQSLPAAHNKLLCLSHVVRENSGGQTLRHTVLDRDRFVEIAIRQQIEQRPECFMTNNLEIRFRIHQTRRHVTAAGILFAIESLAPVKNFAAFIL